MKKFYGIILALIFVMPLLGQNKESEKENEFQTSSGQIVIAMEVESIEFDENGFIISGLIEGNQKFMNDNGDKVPCKSGTLVKFNAHGYLIHATLSEDRTYTNSAGEVVDCFAGEEVGFDINGLLNR